MVKGRDGDGDVIARKEREKRQVKKERFGCCYEKKKRKVTLAAVRTPKPELDPTKYGEKRVYYRVSIVIYG